MRRLVDADIDAAHVFADESKQQHNHAAHEKERGEHAGVAYGNFGIEEFLVNDVEACEKTYEGADNANKSRSAERLDRKCGKAVDPEPDKACDGVAGAAFEAAAVLHFDIAEVLGGTENEPANVGKRVGVTHDFIDDELAHNEETGGAKRLGLTNNRFGHFLVDPGAKATEQVLCRVFVVAVNDVVAFF